MSFAALPPDVMVSVCAGLGLRDLFALEQTDSTARALLASPSVESDRIFLGAARRTWTRHLGHAGKGHFKTWRAACVWLEQVCFTALAKCGVKPAVRLLLEAGLLEGGPWGRPAMFDLAQTVLRQRDHLECRRRVAAFVCSRDFVRMSPTAPALAPAQSSSSEEDEAAPNTPALAVTTKDRVQRDNLHEFIDGIDLRHTRDPEEALREMLLRFPFLPIDAGEGADRVIKAVARVYLHQHPVQLAQLEASLDGREHRDPDSVIYILLYSIIMLNTDLHNAQIKVKMNKRAYVHNVKSTVLADVYSDAELGRMFDSIQRAPLRIKPARVESEYLDGRGSGVQSLPRLPTWAWAATISGAVALAWWLVSGPALGGQCALVV